jgi:predicted DNA-binding protein with PD1-like motif
MERLTSLADDRGIRAARVEGIGAAGNAEIGFYDLERKDYDRITLNEELEVVSALGNLGTLDGSPRAHIHAAFGRRDGSLVGGHLFEARVGATLELFVATYRGELPREMDDQIGLPLLDL